MHSVDTQSVCPVCLRVLPARRVVEAGKTYLYKSCPEHGDFRTMVFAGEYDDWGGAHQDVPPVHPARGILRGCPYDCGLCPEHRQRSCCVLLEVTARCSLRCPVCFASADTTGQDMPLADIRRCFEELLHCGGPFNIQLSGGEPTERDDLDEIIRMGKALGYPFFQLNTNGVRIATEPGYVEGLVAAGLDCVFLQFDGVTDAPYTALRGKPLWALKQRAVEACEKAGVGVVLVPTLARGINTQEAGAILDYALAHMPAVRGVHFQPMSRFGRCEVEAARYTLPELLADIQAQTGGRMRSADFSPGNAEDAHCSFSANYTRAADGSLQAWGRSCGCGTQTCCEREDKTDASARARKFVAARWSARRAADRDGRDIPGAASLDAFLDKMEKQTLAVSAMAFMDAWTLDLERLRACYIHVARLGEKGVELIPFCAYNLTAEDGTALYRGT